MKAIPVATRCLPQASPWGDGERAVKPTEAAVLHKAIDGSLPIQQEMELQVPIQKCLVLVEEVLHALSWERSEANPEVAASDAA